MQIKIDEEFLKICESIRSKNLSKEEWKMVESGDMFQTNHYVGGFDGTEEAFCFSFYDDRDHEFWFQLTLEEIYKVLTSEKQDLLLRAAD